MCNFHAEKCSVFSRKKHYPYGISKLQGEQASLQLVDDQFSVICFRQGTVCGFSPRMRLDLLVNTMFKSALSTHEITINNPSIWRPILSIEDAISAYIRAIEASQKISGIFNISSGNYTVGEVADIVKAHVEKRHNEKVKFNIKNVKDFRNYKVSVEKAVNMLSFKPKHTVESILDGLSDHLELFKDFDNPIYYNIQVFKTMEKEMKV